MRLTLVILGLVALSQSFAWVAKAAPRAPRLLCERCEAPCIYLKRIFESEVYSMGISLG
jgi:hypothetical protein